MASDNRERGVSRELREKLADIVQDRCNVSRLLAEDVIDDLIAILVSENLVLPALPDQIRPIDGLLQQ